MSNSCLTAATQKPTVLQNNQRQFIEPEKAQLENVNAVAGYTAAVLRLLTLLGA
jgi:hypothetical protein